MGSLAKARGEYPSASGSWLGPKAALLGAPRMQCNPGFLFAPSRLRLLTMEWAPLSLDETFSGGRSRLKHGLVRQPIELRWPSFHRYDSSSDLGSPHGRRLRMLICEDPDVSFHPGYAC